MSSEWKPITILNPHWEREKNFLCLSSNSLSQKLWGTDAARRVPHRSPTWPNARCSVRRDCLHIDAMSELFFFLGFTPTQLDSCRLGFNSRWFGQKWTISVESGHIGRRPKQAEIGLESCWNSWNRLWMSPKHPKSILHQFYSEYLLLLLCFLFCFCVLFCVSCLLLSLFCESRS